MYYTGILVAIITFCIIGVFHPIVIKAEYHLGWKSWPLFLLAGIISLLLSLVLHHIVASAAMGVLSCTCFWSILELKEQGKRVEKGWFPKNPKKE